MRTQFVRIVDLASGVVAEALEAGRMSGRDAAWAGAVAFDKVRLVDGEPTAITADAPLADFLAGAGYGAARLRVVDGKRTA